MTRIHENPSCIDVAEEPMTALSEYARLPIAFSVDRVLDVTARAEGGFVWYKDL
jgi:hypothetical protein